MVALSTERDRQGTRFSSPYCTVSVVLDRVSVDELPTESFTVPASSLHAFSASSQNASASALPWT